MVTRASPSGCPSTFSCLRDDRPLGNLGKYVFSPSAVSSAAFNRLGCPNTPFSCQFKLDTDHPLVIQNGPFGRHGMAVLVGI